MAANTATPWRTASRLSEFLRREMAPTPERWAATARITLACVICTIPIMVFHLQQPAMMMIGMFMVTRNDLSTTLLGTLLAIIAAILTCGLLLLYYMCVLDLTWLRVLCVPAFIGLGLLMMRVVNPSIFGLGVAICVGFGITIPDTVSDIESLNRIPFQYCWAWILGLSVNLGVQYLMNPRTSHSLLVRGWISRLEAVETLLRELAAGKAAPRARSLTTAFAFHGAAEELRLLKTAEAVEPALKRRESEFTAQILLVDRLATAASVMQAGKMLPDTNIEPLKQRLLRVADACTAWRNALRHGCLKGISVSPINTPAGAEPINRHPALMEMERVIELLPQVASGKDLPVELQQPQQKKSGFLAPDAFSNPDHIHYAVKGMLAGTICYLIFTLLAFPAIYTSVITVILCSLSTVGASAQKGVLRFTGAIVGGALGLFSLMYVFPCLDSLEGFWGPFAAVMALAAYINFGSVRISYVGIQVCLAFCKCTLQDYGPCTELRAARDRLTGIALGLLVFGLINNRLWPVRARETWQAKLSDLFHRLATLATMPEESTSTSEQATKACDLRLKVYRDFGVIEEMRESSKFENSGELHQRLECLADSAKSLFPLLMTLFQHRLNLPTPKVPEPALRAEVRLREALARLLSNMGDSLAGRTVSTVPELQLRLQEFEQALSPVAGTAADTDATAHLLDRLDLYRQACSIIAQLK